jgi:hypothetical protein
MTDLLRRFEENYIPEPNSGCWLWTAAVSNRGYGQFYVGSRRVEQSHVAAYQMFIGSIPEGHIIRHRCDTPACVNPQHLLTGTHRDNALDRESRKRRKPPRGTINGRCKLSESDILAIRESTEKTNKLATRYGIAPAYVRAIKTRRSWRWLL